jgi:hypothetical protein
MFQNGNYQLFLFIFCNCCWVDVVVDDDDDVVAVVVDVVGDDAVLSFQC